MLNEQHQKLLDQLSHSAELMTEFVSSDYMINLTKSVAQATAVFYKELIVSGIPDSAAARITAGYAGNVVPKNS